MDVTNREQGEVLAIKLMVANNMNEIKSIKGFGNLKRADKDNLDAILKRDIVQDLNKKDYLQGIMELCIQMLKLKDVSKVTDKSQYETIYRKYFNGDCDYGYGNKGNKIYITDFISDYEDLLLRIKDEMIKCLMLGVKELDNVAVFTNIIASNKNVDLVIVSEDIKEFKKFLIRPKDWFVNNNLKGFEDIVELKDFIDLMNKEFKYIVYGIESLPIFNNKTGITLDKVNMFKTIQKKIFTHYLYYKGYNKKDIVNQSRIYFSESDKRILNKMVKNAFIGDIGYNYLYLPEYIGSILEQYDLGYFKDILLEERSKAKKNKKDNKLTNEEEYFKGRPECIYINNIRRETISVDLNKVLSVGGEDEVSSIDVTDDEVSCESEEFVVDMRDICDNEIGGKLNIGDIYLRAKTISSVLDMYATFKNDPLFENLEEHLDKYGLEKDDFINFIEGESVDYLYIEKFKKSLEY